LNKTVNSLEKEVDELEHIINFFESKMDVKEETEIINEADNEKIEEIKKNIELILDMQYNVLVKKYNFYFENLRVLFNELNHNQDDKNLGNFYNIN
jgi:hypothetical protein